MLKELLLENFVIAKSLKIPFKAGFNVISGETGAGKTLLLQALNLISGQRSDFSLIRQSEDKATLQAIFELSMSSHVYEILNENGCEIDFEEFLVIKRELYRSGKTKILINNQDCSLSLLKKISSYLFETVSQNLHIELKDGKFQQQLIDHAEEIQEALEKYQKIYHDKTSSLKEMQELESKQDQKDILLESLSKDVEEIESIDFSEENEASLFEKYKTLSDIQESYSCVSSISQEIGSQEVFLEKLFEYEKSLKRLHLSSDKLKSLESSFSKISQDFKNILAELDSYLYESDFSDQEHQNIEKSLSKIKAIKRRFGPTPQEVENHLEKISNEKYILEHLDELIEKKSNSLKELEKNLEQKALHLSKLRHKRAEILSDSVTSHLKKLDMNHSEFQAQIKKQNYQEDGIDHITFVLKTSAKETFIPIAKRASGGELSRILLSIKLALKDEGQKRPIIFDEIDSNIGGETATKIGEKLRILSKSCQIISITHFPQVARSANHHLKLSKTLLDDEIFTSVQTLSKDQVHQELLRMLGGKKTLSTMNIEHPN